MKPNADLRNLIQVSGFCSWQVAKKLGIHENSLYRMLRNTLDDEGRKEIFRALDELEAERNAEVSKMKQAN